MEKLTKDAALDELLFLGTLQESLIQFVLRTIRVRNCRSRIEVITNLELGLLQLVACSLQRRRDFVVCGGAGGVQ